MQIGEPSAGAGGGSPPAASGIEVRFAEIKGLYRPGLDDSAARGGDPISCGYQPGYASNDNRGRIFINHIPRPSASAPWPATRQRDTQYIEVTVTVSSTQGPLPGGLEVEWEWTDPDDPSDAGMHAAAAAYIDPNAATGDDNRGQCDYPTPGAGTGAAFEQLGSFAMTPAGSHGCRTTVSGGQSGVRLHCTNVGGDNFRLRASVSHGGDTAEVETGVMTMWKRIDVEYKVLQGAYTMPVGFERVLQRQFDPCFVQFDVRPPQNVASTDDHLVVRDRQLERGSSRLASSPAHGGVFDHERTPGWFLLVAAKHAVREVATGAGGFVSAPSGGTQFTATAHARSYGGSDPSSQNGEYLEIPVTVTGRVALVLIRNTSVTSDRPDTSIAIPVWWTQRVGGTTRLHLQGTTVVRQFDGGDGSEAHAYSHQILYYPTHRWVHDTNTWETGGLGLSGPLQVALGRPGSWVTNGISPGRQGHFAGRTILFTWSSPPSATLDADPSFQQVIIHEFGHAFGLPHRCGYHNWRDPPGESCTMNYQNNWLHDPGTDTIRPFDAGARGRPFCDHHIRAIREVHLEDNPQIWTW
jgi:hypothetical protein